jgi:hypothetical protein
MPSYDPSLFNVDPYYDDFSEDKKFLRLMFRPGYGVQARELTQIQSLLQNQIERFGSHVFEEGSIVLDGQISENRVKYAKVALGGLESPDDFIGSIISTSGKARARVVHAESGLSGSVVESDRSVLFFEYIEGGTQFAANDLLSATAANGVGITASITGPSCCYLGDALVASVDRGVRFIEGYFVLNDAQSIGAYQLTGSAGNKIRDYSNPTTRIGFSVNKSFVTATDDTSLNDPAFGFYNYAAPGSDRFAIELDITQHGFTATDTDAIENFSRVGFVEFMRVVDGDIVKVEKYPDYAVLEDTLARRTYDESGNYTVTPFELTLKGPTANGATQVLKAELSQGKAYVFGYEFETQGKTKLNIPCARTTREVSRDFARSIGPYTKVVLSGITGSFNRISDLASHPQVILSRGASGAAIDQLGTARIRSLDPYSTGVYNLSLYDIYLSGTGSFEDTTRIHLMGITSGITSHMFTLTGTSGLENEGQASLLYQIPEGSGVTAFTVGNYAVVGYHKQAAASSSFTYEINAYSGMRFPLNDTVNLPDDDIVVFDGNGRELQGTAAAVLPNRDKLSVTVTNAIAGLNVYSYSVQEPPTPSTAMSTFKRNKTLLTESLALTGAWGSTLTGDGRGSTSDTIYLNGYTDVIEVLSLTGTKGASSGINLLPFFNFDNGQRDSFYDWSRLYMVAGTTGVTGPFSATVKYYRHDGTYGAYTVNSYSDYESIPTYTSKANGVQYKLRDCIDFRPDRSLSGDTKGTPWIPSNSSANDNTFSYIHYLPRTDKIAITRDRNFTVISGVPSLNADIPSDDPNAMTLYTVQVNPYTFSSDDASVRYVENKRYTMRDIGDLEKRIEAVEYYTTLSLLEQEAKAKSVRDENGDEMPKRGILVDQFKGHAVADNADPMFAASVDYENNELRPPFFTRAYGLTSHSGNLTGNNQDGIYTLNYTQSAEISHLLASESTIINPFNVINYMGTLSLSPSSDTWYDDTKQPKVRVNVEGENDNWEQNANYGFGTRFNDWESIWFGKQNLNSKNSRPNLSRNKLLSAKSEGLSVNAINSSIAPESMKKIIANKTVARDVLPIARQQEISLNAKGLKPNTQFNVFCDDINVIGYCTGGSPITNSLGEASIKFRFNYPNASTGVYEQNFLVGRHNIRITDVSNIDSVSNSTMAAEATYAVEGAYDSVGEDNQLSTRVLETRRKSVKSEKVVSNLTEIMTKAGEIRGYSDPLSQTFYVDPTKYPSGIFLKSVDLYFNTKDTLGTIPVMVQVRPTLSGYPHPSKVLPFATAVKYSGDINVADLVTAGNENGTNFGFSSPVYLLPGKEYAICVSSNSSNFSLFTGTIGNTILRASEEDPKILVSKQPLMRSLFKPQNTGKLNKSDNETMAIRLNVCKFSGSGESTFTNAALASGTLSIDVNEFRLNAVDFTPEGSTLTYKTIFNSGATTKDPMIPNKNIAPDGGYLNFSNSTSEGGILTELRVRMAANSDGYASPVFDAQKSSMLTVSNLINNENDVDPNSGGYNGELAPTNDGIDPNNQTKARYISKRVTLESGMEAENITVAMSLCNPKKANASAATIKVFVRPVPVSEDDYENVNYVELTTTDTGVSTSDDDFREVSFTNIGTVTLSKFKSFSIKVVMFGESNGAAVPRIRNLRMIAT